jgi:CheY-like chemotaxis protein
MSNDPVSKTPFTGKRFLVVEDEFLIQLDIQGTLEAAGATSVVTASRVDEALKALDGGTDPNEKFDAAVLDLRLDKDSSAPVAERLATTKVPFVFLTGAPNDVAFAKDHASAPIVGKPFDSAALLAALERAMSGKK